MVDLVIRNGTIVDGTGQKAFTGDVAIDGGKIVEVGKVSAKGDREINADGRLVTPGFVDIHTHYDAQATWDPYLTPSSWHGVTTAVMGSCGVGFAPAAPDRHDWLIGLMEGVEDIPGAALHEGIQWAWETFPEYLDALEKQPRVLDIGAQIPHGALRAYVMGERGANNEAATADDMQQMADAVEAAMRAGARGFSTSRTMLHKSNEGVPVPGTFAADEELLAIAHAMDRAGRGVFQLATEHTGVPDEFKWMRKIAQETSRPVSFNLSQIDQAPTLWRDVLGMLEEANAAGENIVGQVAGRSIGVIQCWEGTAHPFVGCTEYLKVGWLPWDERVAELKKPEVRERIVNDKAQDLGEFGNFVTQTFHKLYPFTEGVEYEPEQAQSVAAIAARTGRTPMEVAYDTLMEHDGKGMLYFPLFNYADNDLEILRTLHTHPNTRMGLSDAGAHCGAICDGGMPTFMLTHWARDRKRGERIPLEHIIHRQTQQTASLFGFHDRGVLAPGMRADVNVIDFENLAFGRPKMAYDLPAGGRRLVQQATGYDYTLCNGVVTVENSAFTGELPGKLVRA